MLFYQNKYYHLYKRTNNDEALFRSKDNYLYFLKKYRYYFDNFFDTIAYCLMPTHFHFLVKVKDIIEIEKDVQQLEGVGHLKEIGHLISRAMQTLQSSYTKAINKRYNRHGALFQPHFKAKLIEEEKYYLKLAFYIHNNPIRTGLVEKAEEWEFSSYQDYIELRNGSLPNKGLLLSKYTINEIIEITNSKDVQHLQGVGHLIGKKYK